MDKQYRRSVDKPVVSDKTVLLSVEDLIYTAFTSQRENRVDFKLLQTVFHVLARELRLLQQTVEIKFDDIIQLSREQTAGYNDKSESYSNSSAEGEADEESDKAERGTKSYETRERKDQLGKGQKREKKERTSSQRLGEKEDDKTSSKDWEGQGRSKDRDDKDKSSRDRDKSSGRRKDEDNGEESGRERRRGRERGGERGGERGADGRGGRKGKRKDRDARRQDRGGLGRDLGSQTSGASITVTETTRRGPGGSTDKILVAERTPAARVRPARVGSIEVVTASQFALLGKAVKQLEQITGPLPQPVLPDNETLRQDLAQGRASLQDIMQAVQLNERVQVAEQGLYHMAQLLTQLAQSGTLPPEFAGQVEAMEEYLLTAMAADYAAAGPGGPGGPGSSVGPGGGPGRSGADLRGVHFGASTLLGSPTTGETVSTASEMNAKKPTASAEGVKAQVTTIEILAVLNGMKDELIKEINKITDRAKHTADVALNTSRRFAEKLDIALQVDERINALLQQTAECTAQLRGFDSGFATLGQNFEEQLALMRKELAGAFAMLNVSSTNAQKAATSELMEHHLGMVVELENTILLQQNLHITHKRINDQLRGVIQSVKILHEQKADCGEVADGLHNKADRSCLAGLLGEKDCDEARCDMDKQLAKCCARFSEQEANCLSALKLLAAITDNKADSLMLLTQKDATEASLKAIQKLLQKLEVMLGEPKTAILMRKLAKDASCGACMTPALMEPEDATHGKPLPLPALHPPSLGVKQKPCFGLLTLAPPDIRDHTCRRWVGGSHTLINNNVREKAGNMKVQTIPTKKYEGYGSDRKLYMMEDVMQPCAECNKLGTDEPDRAFPRPTSTGAGDHTSAQRGDVIGIDNSEMVRQHVFSIIILLDKFSDLPF